MDLTVSIPDEIVPYMQTAGSDLQRRALEALGLEEHKSGRISKAQLRKMLGFSTVTEIDGFLKDHGVVLDFTMEDLEQDRADLRRFLES